MTRPSWAPALPERPWRLGRSVAEPLPAGVWLRPAHGTPDLDGHRDRLVRGVGVSGDRLTVAVGAPGAPAVPVADVARFWQDLPPRLRPAVRFLCYGPARLSGGRLFGDVLAQVVGEPVRLLGGLPRPASQGGDEGGVGGDGGGEVLLVGADGAPGRSLRAREFVHLPPGAPAADAAGSPYAVAHRWPLDGLPDVAPGVHRLTGDVVVEVVRSGLWVRPEPAPAHAAQVRGADPDPAHERVLCDAGAEAALPELRRLAQELLRTFPGDLRRAVRLGVCRPTAPDGAVVERPVPDGAVAARSAPVASGSVGRAAHTGLTTLAAEVLRRHPELADPGADPDAVPALAAVLGRLAGAAPEDPAELALLRRGLLMLPVHHGPTGLRATLDEPTRRWYAARPELTDPQACEASTLGPADGPGTTDFLIWSTGGRRTDLLDPLSPDRVLFLPGTRFRVLEPDPGAPGAVLMREVPPGEPASGRGGPDRTAARDLVRARREWRTRTGGREPAEAGRHVSGAAAGW
ncbi:hypothetical protein [Streptomyces sp. CRN 30]|uniref:hypothetical protein n=1 Tax=Streptomyces sp. CRN 30 TaxID=3075613 RepID=UPI002A809E6C|nr:hypothetical protein [Streptomyces sp. CRN 30]